MVRLLKTLAVVVAFAAIPSFGAEFSVAVPEGGPFWWLDQYASPFDAQQAYLRAVAELGAENAMIHVAPPEAKKRYLVARRIHLFVVEIPDDAEFEWWPHIDPYDAPWDTLKTKPEPRGMFSTPNGEWLLYWRR